MNTVLDKFFKSTYLNIASILSRDAGPKILYYHDIYDGQRYYLHGTPLELFKKHIAVLSREAWRATSSLPCKEKEYMLTLDDGFRGIWDCREYICEMGLKPMIFLASDLIGKSQYLDWNEILELQKLGFNFQAHTWSHRRLTEVPICEWDHELGDSRKLLSDKLQKDIRHLCFPQGRFNSKIIDFARNQGYDWFYTCIYGNADKRILPNLICRQLVQEVGPRTFKALLNGGANHLWRHYYNQHCVSCVN